MCAHIIEQSQQNDINEKFIRVSLYTLYKSHNLSSIYTIYSSIRIKILHAEPWEFYAYFRITHAHQRAGILKNDPRSNSSQKPIIKNQSQKTAVPAMMPLLLLYIQEKLSRKKRNPYNIYIYMYTSTAKPNIRPNISLSIYISGFRKFRELYNTLQHTLVSTPRARREIRPGIGGTRASSR